ncbi:LacI family DNA-binding transcriptional regulator [soil metagenome]
MVSINDVAAHAGVSPTTVSHALSGNRKVSDRVRDRVRAAMAELGYVPSRSAQNLARGNTRIIGLVIPDISNGFFAELAKGVEQSAMDEGYNVILCTTGFDHAREVLYLEMIRSRAVDGIVYAAGSPPSNSELAALLGDIPLVLVDEEIPGADATAFVSDNTHGGELAAEHLLGLGHRSCVILAANDQLVSSAQRVDGFLTAWAQGGGEPPRIASGGFTETGGQAAIRPFIDFRGERPFSAVFAVNDLMAIGAIDALEVAGLTVPTDVSVMGFDDIAPGRYSTPSLTTVRQDVSALGSSAARSLVGALEGRSPLDGSRHVLPVQLIARNSTAPHGSVTTEGAH